MVLGLSFSWAVWILFHQTAAIPSGCIEDRAARWSLGCLGDRAACLNLGCLVLEDQTACWFLGCIEVRAACLSLGCLEDRAACVSLGCVEDEAAREGLAASETGQLWFEPSSTALSKRVTVVAIGVLRCMSLSFVEINRRVLGSAEAGTGAGSGIAG